MKTRSEQVRDELGEGLDHFRQAATTAATGVRDSTAKVKDTTVTALTTGADAARSGAKAAKAGASKAGDLARKAKPKRRREDRTSQRGWLLAALLGAGVAAGAIGALVARRRRNKWDEYDPSQAIDSIDGDGTSPSEVVREAAAPAEPVAEEDLIGKASGPSSNSRTS